MNINYQKKDWEFAVVREYPVFFASMFFGGYCDKKLWKKYIGFDYAVKDGMVIDYHWFYPEYHMSDFARILLEKVKDKNTFLSIKKTSLYFEKKLTRKHKSFKSFIADFVNYLPTIAIYFVIDSLIDSLIRGKLLKKTSKEETDKLMNLIELPLLDNFYILEKLSALKNNIKKHLKDFSWIASRYGKIENYSIDRVQKLRKELIEENYLSSYKKQKNEISEAIKRAKALLGKDKHLIDVIQFFIFYRTQRTDIINQSVYYSHNLIKKEAEKMNIGYNDFIFLTYDEIRKRILPKDLIERKKSFTFLWVDNKSEIITGERNEELKKKYLVLKNESTEIKGNIAYPGKIQGIVRIINKNNTNQIDDGAVLVTSMTTPNMIPVMQKAAAFITDEGGITCHAAIIARELKKPCIIGTKIATKVLKDGDVVEVDADKGVVRIIKKA